MDYYAVNTGNIPGIYLTLDAVHKAIEGYKDAVYQSFKNIKDAEQFVLHGSVSVPPHACNKEETYALPIKKKITIMPKPKPLPIANEPDSAKCKGLEVHRLAYNGHSDYAPTAKTIHMYTDGGTIGNGRKDAIGGYGVFIPATSYTTERLIARKLVGKITNNIAELKGIITALKEIQDIKRTDLAFIIHYDSTYAADVITGKKNAYANLELVTQGKQLLTECQNANLNITFNHVYSHTGKKDLHSIGNEVADKLAGVYLYNNMLI